MTRVKIRIYVSKKRRHTLIAFTVELVSKELNHFGVIADLFRPIGGHKPVWEGKMHGVTKIGVFRPLFCVGMLGKSTNYSTGTRPLCSTF